MNEADARVRIDSMIVSAGFKLADYNINDPSVSFERDVRNVQMQERLASAGKIPDYHFYRPQSATPMAFLEAKRVGRKLEDALKQASEYAVVAHDSNTPPMIVFASDGIQVRSRHADGNELTINNYPLDYIPPPSLMQELVSTPTYEQGQAINSVQSIIKLFNKVSGLMLSDGIDAGINRLREFCSLLFIKIMSERGNLTALENWENLSSASGQNLIRTYQDVCKNYQESYSSIFSTTQLNNPMVLEQVISTLTPINFTNSAIDIKGEAFEYFLSEYNAGDKSELGQYFTPRHITEMMATLLSPAPGDKILDPFCGTGGMLISAYSHIRMGLDTKTNNFDEKLAELKRTTLYGNDLSGGASSLAKMNMIILGDGESNIERADSFDSLEGHAYDKVITNIPFNLKGPLKVDQVAPFSKASDIQISNWNSMCVVKCIESLVYGGSAAIILPLTLCNSPKFSQIRDYIAKKCRIRACIRLPKKTFISYTAAQTAILVIDEAHRQQTSDFTFIHLKSDGMSQDKKREPVPENDMKELLEYISENRIHETPNAIRMKYYEGASFLDFQQSFGTQGNVWKLRELLTIKDKKQPLEADKLYAEPSLDSQFNLVGISGLLRLGRNIKAKKIIAEPGDLVIGTLHTNSRNGLFGIADREYICTSQIVATIKADIVPPEYLIQTLRREFPRQLIPTDLVDRETFTDREILNVLIPKPSDAELAEMDRVQKNIEKFKSQLDEKNQEIQTLLDKIS